MRTLLLILTFIVVSFVTIAAKPITGNSNTSLDQYQVIQIGENLYELKYSNGAAIFTIEVCKNKNECCYLLRNEKIEIMYLCSEDGFGMRKMPEKLKKIDTSVYKQMIDLLSFQQQSVISPSRKNEKQALELIACFFPNIVKPESFNLVFKTSQTGNKPDLTSQK
jgi:hypothetical protein